MDVDSMKSVSCGAAVRIDHSHGTLGRFPETATTEKTTDSRKEYPRPDRRGTDIRDLEKGDLLDSQEYRGSGNSQDHTTVIGGPSLPQRYHIEDTCKVIAMRQDIEPPGPDDGRDYQYYTEIVDRIGINTSLLGSLCRQKDPYEKTQRQHETVRINLELADLQKNRMHSASLCSAYAQPLDKYGRSSIRPYEDNLPAYLHDATEKIKDIPADRHL